MSKDIDGSKIGLQWVASTEQGRQFIWEILSFCGVYHDFAGEPNDVFKSLGKREVGLHLLGLLTEEDEELIFSMMREAKNRKILEEIKNDNGSRQPRNIDDIIGTGSDDDWNYDGAYDSGARADI